MNNITRAVRSSLDLDGTSLDCYMLPDGEKRIGITGASEAIGRSKEYLGRLPTRGGNQFKALQQQGYTGCQTEITIDLDRGQTRAKTISVRDFMKVLTWDAIANRRVESIVLLAAFGETGLETLIDDLFADRPTERVIEKIRHFSSWTNGDLKEALRYNKEDWEAIAEQETFIALPSL